MPRFKDQAIVIRCYEWSETSQIVSLLTSQHGIVRGLAKGSKRTSPGAVARYSGGFAVLTGGQAVGIIKSTSDLATLTEWDLQEPFAHLRRDLGAQRIGLYAAQATAAMLADNDPHPTVFTALSHLLQDAAHPTQRHTALLWFQWRLLGECGYRPHLPADILSHQTAAQAPSTEDRNRIFMFDPSHAGIIEATLNQTPPPRRQSTRWPVSASTVAVLRAIATVPGSIPRSILDTASPLDTQAVDSANRLLARYIRTILDRPLSAMNGLFPGIGQHRSG